MEEGVFSESCCEPEQTFKEILLECCQPILQTIQDFGEEITSKLCHLAEDVMEEDEDFVKDGTDSKTEVMPDEDYILEVKIGRAQKRSEERR